MAIALILKLTFADACHIHVWLQGRTPRMEFQRQMHIWNTVKIQTQPSTHQHFYNTLRPLNDARVCLNENSAKIFVSRSEDCQNTFIKITRIATLFMCLRTVGHTSTSGEGVLENYGSYEHIR